MRSVRSVVTREIFLLLAILAAALMVGTFFVQHQIEKKAADSLLAEVTRSLVEEQENLLLQILLNRPKDLNFYFQQLKSRFPSAKMCADFNPRMQGLIDACGTTIPPQWSSFSIADNRNLLIRYDVASKSSVDIFIELWRSPVVLVIGLVCVILAGYLRVRMGSLLSEPLVATEQAIEQLLKGVRKVPKLAPHSVLEWRHVESRLEQLVSYLQSLEKVEYEAGQAKIARQVAHDIRSPLSLLKIASQVYNEAPAAKRAAMVSAINRIEEIVDSLASSRMSNEGFWDVRQLVLQIIEEKRLTAPTSIEFLFETNFDEPAIAFIDPPEFTRILSNILNNSVEAISLSGRITVRLINGNETVLLQFLDTGKGISSSAMELVECGFSVDKPHGQGLGLSFARERLQAWGGKLVLSSAEGIGTILTLTFRKKLVNGTESLSIKG